jgi:hypothetical protein
MNRTEMSDERTLYYTADELIVKGCALNHLDSVTMLSNSLLKQ